MWCKTHSFLFVVVAQIYSRTMGNTFNVPFPNARSLYEFQVRVRMSSTCGQSDLWSEWSEPVFWGSMKKINDTGNIITVEHNVQYCAKVLIKKPSKRMTGNVYTSKILHNEQ